MSVKSGLHSEGKTEWHNFKMQRWNFQLTGNSLEILVCVVVPAWHGCVSGNFPFAVRAKEQFEATLLDSDGDMTPHPSEKQILHCYCNLVNQIGSTSHTLGKDGKFQLFVCLCARWVLLPPLSLLLLWRSTNTDCLICMEILYSWAT